MGRCASPRHAKKNSRLPGSRRPALVSGVADAHQMTSPLPRAYFTTRGFSTPPYSFMAELSGYQYACGARVISEAARVIDDKEVDGIRSQVKPAMGSGMAYMCPPEF